MANESSSSGVGFLGLLGIVFIVLKLNNAIDWSWWWVLAPFWIDGLLIVLLLILWAVVKIKEKRWERFLKKQG